MRAIIRLGQKWRETGLRLWANVWKSYVVREWKEGCDIENCFQILTEISEMMGNPFSNIFWHSSIYLRISWRKCLYLSISTRKEWLFPLYSLRIGLDPFPFYSMRIGLNHFDPKVFKSLFFQTRLFRLCFKISLIF